MNNLWNEMIILEKIFFLCAFTGGVAFVISAGYQLLAGGVSGDFDAPLDSDVSFKLLSFFGVSSFLTLFGLAGLAASRASGLDPLISIGLGLVAGVLNYKVMQFIFKSFSLLQSTGKSNNINNKKNS